MRALLAVVIAATLAPAPAFASRADTDRICGVELGSGRFERRSAPDITATSGLIVDTQGRALWSRSCTTSRPMASITKIMVALVVLDRADLDDEVTVSKAGSEVPYALGLRAGERLTIRQLLELALVASSNDAAYALAENVGGSVPAFSALMNERAQELGMADSHFVNPHGLDASGHYSSAADIVTMTRTAMSDPEFRRIVALRSVTLPAYKGRGARKIKNTNELLGNYAGMIGVKTGFTDRAGYDVVTSAERNGVTLTAVVMGTRSNPARFRASAKLLNWGFKHLKVRPIASATETVGAVAIEDSPSETIEARFAETTSAPVFDLDGPVTRSLSMQPKVDLPVFEGQPLGEVSLAQGERHLATLPVVASADLASVGETVGAVPVSDYLDATVTARASETSVPVPEFDSKNPVQRKVSLRDRVAAPVAKGDRLGEILYSQNGKPIVRVPVVAAAAVKAPGVLSRVSIWFSRGWRKLIGEPIMASVQVAE